MIYSVAEKQDIELISSLFLSSFAPRIRKKFNLSLNKKIIEEIIALYMDSSRQGFIVAKEKGKVVGFICVVSKLYHLCLNIFSLKRLHKSFLYLFIPRTLFVSPPSIKHLFSGHVITLAVDKKYRKKGVAMKLITRAFSYLKKNNVKEVYFQIPADDKQFVNKFLQHNCKIIKKINKYGGWLMMKKSIQ